MKSWRFNSLTLATAVRQERGTRGLRAVAQETGVSASTLSRIENGYKPDIDTFIILCDWMNADPRAFFAQEYELVEYLPFEQ